MPSWFKKVFGGDDPQPETTERSDAAAPGAALPQYGEQTPPSDGRRVVHAEVLVDEEECSSWSDDIRIKARPGPDGMQCVFMVDRPVFEGHSAWFPKPQAAAGNSPLAEALFEIQDVTSVLLHDTTVTIGSPPTMNEQWQERMKEIGAAIREFLKSGREVVSKAYRDAIPAEDEIRARLQKAIDEEINPGIAAHSGVISLARVEGNTVYITMGGGCQGCAASQITLKEGVHRIFRERVPELGAIYDETDHSAGKNPYYRTIPAER